MKNEISYRQCFAELLSHNVMFKQRLLDELAETDAEIKNLEMIVNQLTDDMGSMTREEFQQMLRTDVVNEYKSSLT